MFRTDMPHIGGYAQAHVAARGRRRVHGRRRATVLILLAGVAAHVAAQPAPNPSDIERGRYLVLIGHCNNCHTAGYTAASGQIDEAQWLTGNPVGWRIKQGTSYAINLRLFVQNLGVDDWLRTVRTVQSRAPMPWWSLRETSEPDLRAIYAYIRSLTPLGESAPAFLPANQVPPLASTP